MKEQNKNQIKKLSGDIRDLGADVVISTAALLSVKTDTAAAELRKSVRAILDAVDTTAQQLKTEVND